MTDPQLHDVLFFYQSELYRRFSIQPRRHSISKLEHAAWMCEEARKYLVDGKRDKVMRWLGFIQGILWYGEIYSIEELKDHNRSREEEGSGTTNQTTVG